MKIKLHDNRVKVFNEIRYVPKLKRNLISLRRLNFLSYGFSIQVGVMRVSRVPLVIMKISKHEAKNLYILKGSTLIGGL